MATLTLRKRQTASAPEIPAPTTPVSVVRRPAVLLVLDGWGVASKSTGNAIALAKTPNMNQLMADYPAVTLHASGEQVGLPWNEMGNSEVGHLNIGAGRILYQNLPRIDRDIASGAFFQNSVILEALQTAKQRKSKVHFVGLTSNGGIHSSIKHLYALLELCKQQEMTDNIFIHAILDGRDTAKNAALQTIAELETQCSNLGVGRIATLMGRFWAMDRDNRWERIEAAYNAIRHGVSDSKIDSPLQAIENSYRSQVFDEEFVPTVILDNTGEPMTTIEDSDVIVFFNFRADRARQLTKAFVLPGFTKFERGSDFNQLIFVTMTEYEKNIPVRVAYEPEHTEYPIARVVADAGLKQLHVAETEKYAHVTFFFNGGAEEPFPGEERSLLPSPRVASYDLAPDMNAQAVADKIIEGVNSKEYGFIVANFANADMVGHTGNLSATIQAVETVDQCIGKILQAVQAVDGTLVITADHGNAEVMIDAKTGQPNKEHTKNPVPCILVSSVLKEQRSMWPSITDGDISRLQPVGVLSDLGPTVVTLLGLPVPKEMNGRSLIRLSVPA
jgi:2,3-bisphosphoglycerate-independent phosphoglycerate mutase